MAIDSLIIENSIVEETESNVDLLKNEINIFCELFVNANFELKKVKESCEILDVDKLKLIFWEVNIKKEWIIVKIFEMPFEEYKEIEMFLSFNFYESAGPLKRAFAELKAWVLNGKSESL